MRLLLLAALVGAASAFCPNEVFHNQTACSCSDYFDGAVVKCSGPEGPMIVEKLKSTHVEIRELVLEKANIIEIGPRAFKNLRIKKLVLDQNRIKSFHKNAFDGLQNCLQELSIAHNRLTKIPTDALNGLRGLNVLNLRCNRIQDLEESVFQNVTSVMDINLSCNQICSINGTAFESIRSSIQSLTLDNNCLTEFPAEAVANMDNLIAFHAKTNLINELAANDVTNLTSLSILVLTGNNISLVHPEAVHGCPNLRYVYLAENSLSTFENGAMSQFEHAQVVDLSFNYIKKVEADTFSGLESLQHINLESNQVSEIAPGAFSGTPLLLLWLPNNCISNVTAAMFQGAPFLRQVSLANNNINDIEPLSFAHLANLHTLDLAYNRIMELRNNAISGSDYLTVRLQENPMICEDESYHVMNGAEPVYLTGEPNIICKGNWKMLPAPVCPQGVPRPLPSPCCQKDQGRASKLPSTTTTAAPESEELPDYGEEGSGEDEEEEEEEDAKTNVVKGPAPVADVPLVKVVAPNTTTAAAAPAPAKTTAKPVHRKVVEEEVLEDETEEIEDEEEEEEEEAPVTTTVAATTTTTAQVTTASTIPSVAAQQSKSRKVNMERFLRLANKGKFEDAIKKKSVFHLPASEQKKLAGVPAKKIVYEEEEEEGKEEGEDEKKIVAQEVEFSKDPRVGEEEEVEYEEGEAEGEEYEEEEEETPAPTTTTTTTTTTVAPRRVPARLLDRKLNRGRMLPPWMRNRHMSKEKTSAPVESAEFSHDSQVQTVQVAERIPII